ncbi:GerAB/ArcD/ProY family transporter [Gracilibacillus suaedae]|uniref:GerAB/ArcD/ProY family transporter n=1 Tax=Gracilibacillus suaedae TaxID=2820273 RepID=UPI001ABDCA12|nr:endospore germination permease [Gracilibacillus suaedae]
MKVQLSVSQFTVLVISFSLGSSVLILPAILTKISKNDAWITMLIGIGISVLLVYLYNQIATISPRQTLVDIHELVLGKWIGKAFTIVYMYSIFIIILGNLEVLVFFLNTHILIETPSEALFIISIGVALYGLRKGLEVIARGYEIFLPLIILMSFLFLILLLKEIKLDNIQPLLTEGVLPIIVSLYSSINFPYSEMLLFLMILPYVNNFNKGKKYFYVAVIIAGIFTVIIILMNILVLSWEVVSRNVYPTYTLGKKISIAEFFERLEVLIALVWVICIMFKIIIAIYAFLTSLSKLFECENYQPFLLPFGLIVYVYAIAHTEEVTKVQEDLVFHWPFLSTITLIIMPLIVLIVSKIRKVRS